MSTCRQWFCFIDAIVMTMKRHLGASRSPISRITYVHKLTKKQYARNWLCYSEEKGSLYCFTCKLVKSGVSKGFTKELFNPWKNAGYFIRRHEERSVHNQILISMLVLKNIQQVSVSISNLYKRKENEQRYYHKNLALVTEATIFAFSFLVKKDMQPMISTSWQFEPVFSFLRNSVCLW